ncbi:MAG: hypothetical protein U1U88_001722 [Lawsonella clevelandensis]
MTVIVQADGVAEDDKAAAFPVIPADGDVTTPNVSFPAGEAGDT